MKCRFCGTLLSDNAKFCSKCGQRVESHGQSESVMNSNTAEDAYYREIDDEEYAAIKKKEKEEERAREEAAKQKAAEQKRAKEKAEREQYEQRMALEEERRRYEQERKKYEEERRKTEQERKRLYEGYDNPEKIRRNGDKEAKKPQNKPEKGKKNKIGISVFAYLLIILIGGFALYRTGIVDNVISSINKTSEKKENGSGTSSTKKDKIEKKSDEGSKKKTESTTEGKYVNQKLADTDNSSMNIDACNSPEVYNTVTSQDGSFSFGYPKYLFNHSQVEKSGTSYTLSYKENSGSADAKLTVYTEDNQGNALENAKQLYRRFSSSVYKTYFKMEPTRIDSKGMARALIGGSVNSSETKGVYIIAANDGEKNYILKFTYPDSDMDDNYNMIDYVVDCVYRYCSFSGGTYKPRTYQQFLKDDMGTKK